ncbi:MAG: PAS domain S-box protein, partial [Desulfobacterales bacterium]
MNLVSIPPIVMAGIALYVGAYHLLIYSQRQAHHEDLNFGLSCLMLAFYDILCAGLYNSTSVQEGLSWQRRQVCVLALGGILFLRFLRDYTRQVSRKWVRGFSVYFTLAAIVGLVDRSNLTWISDQPSIKKVMLPYDFEIIYHEAASGPLVELHYLAGLLLLAYIVQVCIRFYRQGNYRKARPLFLSVLLLFIGLGNDAAIKMELYKSVYLMEYAYMGIILVMAHSLSLKIVAAALMKEALRASEEKYRQLNEELELRVDQRTDQLAQSVLELQSEIAKRRQTETALKENEARYRQLLNHAPAGIYEVDFTTGKLVSVNDVICEYTGYTREKLLSMSVLDLLSEESQKRFLERLDRLLAGQAVPETLEYKIIGKNGREFWVLLNAKYFYENGNLKGATVVVHDITERKRAEEEKNSLKSQLRWAQKMESIGTLAGGIAHDFNNLLMSVQGYTSLMLLDTDPAHAHYASLKNIEKQVQNGANLSAKLLGYARKGKYQVKPFNLN